MLLPNYYKMDHERFQAICSPLESQAQDYYKSESRISVYQNFVHDRFRQLGSDTSGVDQSCHSISHKNEAGIQF